jgi:YD repeat-containing protein
MRIRIHVILTLVLSLPLTGALGWGRSVDLSPPTGEVGAANVHGYLEIWREIDGVGVNLAQGSFLPLRYMFSTDPKIQGALGVGFYVPIFEARNILIREQMMVAYLPCGKWLYLRRDTVDPNKFQTLDHEWTGYLSGDDFIIWREDGWKVRYHNNRLDSITSDDHHIFTWSYDDDGRDSVNENGQAILTMERNVAGQIAAFVSGGKRWEATYSERPITQMLAGQVAIKELDQALSTFKYPDGTIDTFKFGLTTDLVPTLTVVDKDKRQTVYTWDANTGHLATEKGPNGDWNYNIGTTTQPFSVPPISRTSSDGKRESVAIDTRNGTYTVQNADGTTTVSKVFETPGPLYHKLRSLEKVSNGVTSALYKASYDEAGNLIREMDDNGWVTTFSYDSTGKKTAQQTTLSSDPNFLSITAAKRDALIKRLKG